jgi:NAD(P)H-hydrate epimerase
MSFSDQSHIPVLTGEEMSAVDRAMFDACGLDVLQVMEVAGRAVASWIRAELFQGRVGDRRIVFLCGSGGNGGDGLVAAKYLDGWGAQVSIVQSSIAPATSITGHQLEVMRRLGVEPRSDDSIPECDVIVDAMLGFGATGAPRGRTAELIAMTNRSGLPVVSVDLPSGLDATAGTIHDPCITAASTITLGLPKTGLLSAGARKKTGRVVVADIGIPMRAFEAAGLPAPSFRWETDFLELGDR